ncbi:Alpha/Beta hydrolase protein [Mycena pura]|uniref:Alpha/Beta hydrolase protein n=1 Tax=Mycena pura TaxID=153505 RepID=A0AAD6YQG0_9AGAR|nr:Alpha/Beta hydrolase protein [Mycena pura]
MYSSEKLMNFRWISKIVATYAPYTLSSKDLASPQVQEYLSEIGQFTEIAYVHGAIPTKFIFDNLETLLEPTFPLDGYHAVRDAQLVTSFIGKTANLPGIVAYRAQAKQLILAISGTRSALQALYDLYAIKHRHPSRRGRVHTGFWRLYKGIKSLALDGVRKGLAEHDVKEFVLSGHSMGAVVSQFLLLDILRDETILPINDIPIKFVGFGGPRSATKGLVSYWQELFDQRREKYGTDSISEYSVKMYNDGVPSLPPLILGYRHYAQAPFYLVHGRLYQVPADLCEYALFHVTSDADDEKPPAHPRGGHNYYNNRDMERFRRRNLWLDKAMKKGGDWKDLYGAKVAKHDRMAS